VDTHEVVAPVPLVVVRGWLVNGEGLVGREPDGLVDLCSGQTLGLEELDALGKGGILCLVGVRRAGKERARLAFGSDKKATAFLNASCLSIVATRFALRPGHIFRSSVPFSLHTVMLRLAAHRALPASSRALSLQACRYARCRTTTCMPSPSPSVPAFSFRQSFLLRHQLHSYLQ